MKLMIKAIHTEINSENVLNIIENEIQEFRKEYVKEFIKPIIKKEYIKTKRKLKTGEEISYFYIEDDCGVLVFEADDKTDTEIILKNRLNKATNMKICNFEFYPNMTKEIIDLEKINHKEIKEYLYSKNVTIYKDRVQGFLVGYIGNYRGVDDFITVSENENETNINNFAIKCFTILNYGYGHEINLWEYHTLWRNL